MINSKDKQKNIHSGHRSRTINTVYNAKLENIGDVQALEFILFYIFPRGDVNPLAHRLLDRYKNIATVMEASVEDLKTVEGMGEMSAKKLNLLLSVFERYHSSKLKKKTKITNIGELYDYLEATLRFKHTEETHIIGINGIGEVVGDRMIARGNAKNVSVEMNDIALFVSTYRVPTVVLVHNHPNGTCESSLKDVHSNEKLSRLFEFSGTELYDNIIIGSDGIYSMKSERKLRFFL